MVWAGWTKAPMSNWMSGSGPEAAWAMELVDLVVAALARSGVQAAAPTVPMVAAMAPTPPTFSTVRRFSGLLASCTSSGPGAAGPAAGGLPPIGQRPARFNEESVMWPLLLWSNAAEIIMSCPANCSNYPMSLITGKPGSSYKIVTNWPENDKKVMNWGYSKMAPP